MSPTSYSNYLEDAINNAAVGGGTLSVAAVYVKLHIGDPGEDCTASPAAEATRKLVTFGASSAGTSVSNSLVEWLSVAATETYSFFSLWDAVSAGNALGSGPLSVPKSVTLGDTFNFAIGDLSFTSA